MAYAPITPTEFREKGGVLVDKLGDEFKLIGDELAALAPLEARIAALEEAKLQIDISNIKRAEEVKVAKGAKGAKVAKGA